MDNSLERRYNARRYELRSTRNERNNEREVNLPTEGSSKRERRHEVNQRRRVESDPEARRKNVRESRNTRMSDINYRLEAMQEKRNVAKKVDKETMCGFSQSRISRN